MNKELETLLRSVVNPHSDVDIPALADRIIALVKSENKTIQPVDKAGGYRTGGLVGLTAKEIEIALGFKANIKDDPDKVKYSWGFTVNGVRCGVWDYKGSAKYKEFSTFGPADTLRSVFGSNYQG